MDIKIPTGIKHHKELTVGKENLAIHFGSGDVAVLATPAMIAMLEQTAKESIREYLPEGYTTVGSEIHIKHLKATPEGSKVTTESYLKDYYGSKLVFELHAWDQKGMIGIGTHTRVIVNEKEFMARFN